MSELDASVELRRSRHSFPAPPSQKEAMFHYAGLPSGPRLVTRTGTIPWTEPPGRETYRKLRVTPNSTAVKWTSTDVVHIGSPKEPFAPVILWIGVLPASLSGHDGVIVAHRCRQLLVKHNIDDVDVEIRHSVVKRLAGPKFYPTRGEDDASEVFQPRTTTLGLPICAQSTPWAEGTGGFFIGEGENSERLFLVTARYVLFPRDDLNQHYEHKNSSQPKQNVLILAAFDKYLESISDALYNRREVIKARMRTQTRLEGFPATSQNL